MTPFHPADLAGTWIHSHEEDADGVKVFRPASYAFPPARGRDALGLQADGSLVNSIPGPDDRPTTQPTGSWKLDGKHLTLHSQGGAGKQFAVESVDGEKLRLRPL